jgi:hypothetical protein
LYGAKEIPPAAPTDLECELIEVVGAAIADGEICSRCGARLNRPVQVTPGSSSGLPPGSWRMFIVARCRGWRRHRHFAEVTTSLGDLRFSPFRRR